MSKYKYKYRCRDCQGEFEITDTSVCPKCGGKWEYIERLRSEEEEAGIVKVDTVPKEACMSCKYWKPLESWKNVLCFWENDPHGRCSLNPKAELTSHKYRCGSYELLLFKGLPAVHFIEDAGNIHEYCKIGLQAAEFDNSLRR